MNKEDQERNEVLRTEGRSPETPVAGYRFGESACLTSGCGGRVKYEISTAAPWRLNTDHVICGRCAATYKVTLERADAPIAQITFLTADDRQS
jgi:hypothetical protein